MDAESTSATAQRQVSATALPRIEFNTRNAILITLLLILGWNLSCCLFTGIAGTPLHLYARSDGSTWYYVVGVSWLGLQTNQVAPLSGEWWRVVAANLAFTVFIVLPVVRRVVSRRREEATRAPQAGEGQVPTSSPPRSTATHVHLVSEERVEERRSDFTYAAATSGALLVLMAALGSIDAVLFGLSFLAALIAGLTTWALYSRAHRTVLVCGEEELRLQTGRRRIWSVRWDQIVGWHRENGYRAVVKCIVLDCADGSTRRIKVGWLGKQVWFYADFLRELRVRTGKHDGTPIDHDDTSGEYAKALEQRIMVFVLAGLVVLFILVLLINHFAN